MFQVYTNIDDNQTLRHQAAEIYFQYNVKVYQMVVM